MPHLDLRSFDIESPFNLCSALPPLPKKRIEISIKPEELISLRKCNTHVLVLMRSGRRCGPKSAEHDKHGHESAASGSTPHTKIFLETLSTTTSPRQQQSRLHITSSYLLTSRQITGRRSDAAVSDLDLSSSLTPCSRTPFPADVVSRVPR